MELFCQLPVFLFIVVICELVWFREKEGLEVLQESWRLSEKSRGTVEHLIYIGIAHMKSKNSVKAEYLLQTSIEITAKPWALMVKLSQDQCCFSGTRSLVNIASKMLNNSR